MATPERTLELLGLLQRRRDWSGWELAERLEVSGRTLRRDVDRLRGIGYPIESTPGVDGGYRLAPGASLPPLVLGDDEAVALVVALRTAAHTSIGGASELAVQVLSKVQHVLPPRLRRRADAFATMTSVSSWPSGGEVDLDVLTVIADAALATERLEFDYRDRAGAGTDRLVEPNRLVLLGRRWYLVAYDTGRHDWRTFRVDRITRARTSGKRFVPKQVPGGDPVEFVLASIGEAPNQHAIEVEVAASGADVERRFGRWCTVTALGPARCTLTMTSDAFEWPVMILAGLGVPCRVIGDDTFRQYVADMSARLTDATS